MIARSLVLLFVLGLAAAPRTGFGAPVPETVAASYRDGNVAYEAGDYSGAVAAYRSAIDEGYTAPELEYNLGNAHLKNGDLGWAILHYRRALKLRPGYESATANLEYARSLLQGVETERPAVELRWLERLRLGLDRATAALVLAGFLFAALSAVRLVVRSRGLVWPVLQGVTAGLVLLSGAAFLFEFAEARGENEGVVVADEVDVRSGPAETQTVSFRLSEGIEVELGRTAEGWREVRVSDGLEGWAPVEAVPSI